MPVFQVKVEPQWYSAIVERGALERILQFIPARAGKIFVVTTEDVWQLHGERVRAGLGGLVYDVIFLPGGEERKRLTHVETAAEEMVRRGGDRSSVVVAFGGGIVCDMAGFLAAIFMRGVPVVQVPTTLLAQVDAGIGGKTGVNLVSGKNLIGSFHQPLAVLVDPGVLETLSEREYRAGLYEIIKAGIIRSEALFRFLTDRCRDVLARDRDAVDHIIAESVRIKAEVVTADERESNLRRILNLGHTFGHALEAETAYARFLHGEAVAFGMKAAVYLSQMTGHLSAEDSVDILETLRLYGPIPPLDGIAPERLLGRLTSDKKTVRGKVHFVLPERVGEAKIVSGIEDRPVLEAIRSALA
jgi:3-dehydroquinate synthase